MTPNPKVSICIPAYKSASHLQKALNSCLNQDFENFEIIITDDSPQGYLQDTLALFKDTRIHYFHNEKALGSPRNWNQAISKAQGEYIKILHHDDWFTSSSSLRKFVELLDRNPNANLAFSGSLNCDSKGNPKHPHSINPRQVRKLTRNPSVLFRGNFVGAPSATIYRNNIGVEFDPALKWLVDIEFYIRCLKKTPQFAYTTELLVSITTGSEDQVTAISSNNGVVELSEQIHVYNKFKQLYSVDIHCLYHLWKLCSLFSIHSKAALIGHGIPISSINQDIETLVKFNRLNDRAQWAFKAILKVLSPAFWANCFLRRLAYILIRLGGKN